MKLRCHVLLPFQASRQAFALESAAGRAAWRRSFDAPHQIAQTSKSEALRARDSHRRSSLQH
eukprot:113877-Pyramimonas_sp.AAC.1